MSKLINVREVLRSDSDLRLSNIKTMFDVRSALKVLQRLKDEETDCKDLRIREQAIAKKGIQFYARFSHEGNSARFFTELIQSLPEWEIRKERLTYDPKA